MTDISSSLNQDKPICAREVPGQIRPKVTDQVLKSFHQQLTRYIQPEVGLVRAMAVLDGELVLVLVGGLDLGDGEHDHVVVAADQLVAAALGDVDGALVEAERRRRVTLDEHVAASRLVCRAWHIR